MRSWLHSRHRYRSRRSGHEFGYDLVVVVGTAITSMALESSLGSLAPAIVGTIFALLTFVPLTALAIIDR